MNAECIFCKIISGQIQSPILYQDEHVFVIKDINPQAPIHNLVIPKKHIENLKFASFKDEPVLSAMLFMAQKIGKSLLESQDYRLKLNNGYSAGQRVFHMHMHFLAGKEFSD